MGKDEGDKMNGRVSLVGAGPGNPELITVLGKRRLDEADVVVYDHLVSPALLSLIHAKKINVGKLPHHHKFSQYEINELLVQLAQEGKQVVRLKAGDPYVFGRGGEEGQYLKKQKIDFEVIPGITSAIAGLGAAGIPITHRDYASSFHIITGHKKSDGNGLDWNNIARQEGTLVFLMGMEELENIASNLIENGKSPQTPTAVIQWATHWKQKTVRSNLANIDLAVKRAGISSPALIVVGQVVKLMTELAPDLPLEGKHLLIPFKKNSKLFKRLQDKGASVDFFKRSQLTPLNFTLPSFKQSKGLIIPNIKVFDCFSARLVEAGKDYRSLQGWTLIAMNQMVANKLKQRGIIVDECFNGSKNYPNSTLMLNTKNSHNLEELQNRKFKTLTVCQKESIRQDIEFDNFHAVIIPSTASLEDLVTGCNDDQLQRLQSLKIFAMGKLVAEGCFQAGLKNIVSVQPSINGVISAVVEEIE